MKADYLWDRSGAPDPEVERLERLLATLRSQRPAPEFPAPASAARRPWRFAVAAAVALVAAATWITTRGVSGGWEVARVNGAPLVGGDRIRETGRLAVGEWLVTDDNARARVAVGQIGELEVEPNSRVRLVQSRPAEHRIALQRGEIHAMIWAPPRRFYVDTPSAVAVDLGCAYDLKVSEDGTGLLSVRYGWVAFERDGRESFIPAGAACRTHPGVGPGTPYLDSAPAGFQRALEQLDFENGGRAALVTVLAQSRKEDAVTLWHLLSRTRGADRAEVYERMANLVAPPTGVTRDGVLAGDRKMLDLWWNRLGLEDASWWRMWEGPYPGR